MKAFEAFVAERYLKTRKKGAFVRTLTRYARWGIGLGVHGAFALQTHGEDFETRFPRWRIRRRAHQLAAESFAWDGKYQNAILEYRKALQLKPDLESAHRGIAEMYWEQRQFEKATQEYVVELQKFPLDDEAHLRIGEYLLSQGKAGEAVPQLETALQVN